jgi:hypothetical protein
MYMSNRYHPIPVHFCVLDLRSGLLGVDGLPGSIHLLEEVSEYLGEDHLKLPRSIKTNSTTGPLQ